MSANFDDSTRKLIIYTGNVLNLSEIKKKVGQTLTEEVDKIIWRVLSSLYMLRLRFLKLYYIFLLKRFWTA